MLEWASDRLDKWYAIGKFEVSQKAAKLLEKRGVIWPQTNLFRLKPQK